jgi:hypothetical protein
LILSPGVDILGGLQKRPGGWGRTFEEAMEHGPKDVCDGGAAGKVIVLVLN